MFMGDDFRRVVRVASRVGGIAFTYLLVWAFPGAWFGELAKGWFGRVPEGWAVCMPDMRPALMNGAFLALLLGSIEARVGSRWRAALVSFASPVIVIAVWLFVSEASSLEDARWWLSMQVPAIALATLSAVMVWARVLKPSKQQEDAWKNRPPNDELQRTRPAEATQPRR